MNHSDYILNRFKICRTKKRKRRIFSIFFLIIGIVSLFFTYCVKIVNPIIYEFSTAEIERLIIKASNSAINLAFSNYDYKDIVSIEYDKEGNISFIKVNQIQINKIISFISMKTQEHIDEKTKIGIFIPIGTCSGIGFLSGKGSEINININPIGNVVSFLKSEFKEAGINQTIHKLYIDIQCEMSIILPFGYKKVTKNLQSLVSESLIIGKIPNIYFQTENLSDFY